MWRRWWPSTRSTAQGRARCPRSTWISLTTAGRRPLGAHVARVCDRWGSTADALPDQAPTPTAVRSGCAAAAGLRGPRRCSRPTRRAHERCGLAAGSGRQRAVASMKGGNGEHSSRSPARNDAQRRAGCALGPTQLLKRVFQSTARRSCSADRPARRPRSCTGTPRNAAEPLRNVRAPCPGRLVVAV